MKTKCDGVKVYELAPFSDHRGKFYEAYNQEIMEYFRERFVQTNISVSQKGVFRGMHYQYDEPMGKMITCLSGEIVDFWMDIREGSPTYGTVESLRLAADKPTLLYIPPGFAHGFCSVTDSVIKYECTSYYNSSGEGAITYKEIPPHLLWHCGVATSEMLLSKKDAAAQSFAEYRKNPKFMEIKGK